MMEKKKRNYLHRMVEGFLLTMHTATNPSVAEWDEMIATATEHRERTLGTLVYTEGGAPNALQRKQHRDVYVRDGVDTSPSTAILTSSVMARAAITAFNLFLQNKMRGFPPSEVEMAMDFLDIPKEKRRIVHQSFEELKRELGIKS